MTAPTYDALLKFVRETATLTKDGETQNLQINGDEIVIADRDDEFDMENDDCYDTLHEVISEARELVGLEHRYDKELETDDNE